MGAARVTLLQLIPTKSTDSNLALGNAGKTDARQALARWLVDARWKED